MKAVCDNCHAVYKVPDAKLTKPVNKATCRNCGHRMLIPRPKPGADPEERTLVTAVPPTPAGAPSRTDGPATSPMEHEEPEATLPGRAPSGGSSFPGTPLPARPRNTAQIGPSAATTVTTPPPKAATPGIPTRRATPEPAQRQEPVRQERRPEPRPEPPRAPSVPPPETRRQTPEPRPRQRTPMPPPPRQEPEPLPAAQLTQPPQPSPMSLPPTASSPPGYTPLPAPSREPVFDPSTDLTFALLGTLLALFGAFTLASLTLVSSQMLRVGLSGIGLTLAIAGSMTTLLILLTGARGTRPARTILSIVVSGGFSFVLSGLAVSTSLAALTLLEEAQSIQFNAPPVAKGPAVVEPTVAGTEPEPAVAAVENDGSADAVEPAPTQRPTPGPRPPPAPAPAPTAGPSPAPAPGAAPMAAPVPPPAPAPPPAPVAPAGVPMDVIQVMLHNNLGVKKCFVPLFKTGNVPARVDIRFTIQPTGSVSAANIQQADLQGGEFETCMRSAVMGVAFPPFQGSPQTLTFPFVLSR